MLAFRQSRSEAGQATVEFALCTPFIALLFALLVEVGMLGADQVRLWHAASEAVRVASVDGDEQAMRSAAERSGLEIAELEVEPPDANRTQGGPVRVELTHHPEDHIPLAGAFLSRITLTAEATMRIEQP